MALDFGNKPTKLKGDKNESLFKEKVSSRPARGDARAEYGIKRDFRKSGWAKSE